MKDSWKETNATLFLPGLPIHFFLLSLLYFEFGISEYGSKGNFRISEHQYTFRLPSLLEICYFRLEMPLDYIKLLLYPIPTARGTVFLNERGLISFGLFLVSSVWCFFLNCHTNPPSHCQQILILYLGVCCFPLFSWVHLQRAVKHFLKSFSFPKKIFWAMILCVMVI